MLVRGMSAKPFELVSNVLFSDAVTLCQQRHSRLLREHDLSEVSSDLAEFLRYELRSSSGYIWVTLNSWQTNRENQTEWRQDSYGMVWDLTKSDLSGNWFATAMSIPRATALCRTDLETFRFTLDDGNASKWAFEANLLLVILCTLAFVASLVNIGCRTTAFPTPEQSFFRFVLPIVASLCLANAAWLVYGFVVSQKKNQPLEALLATAVHLVFHIIVTYDAFGIVVVLVTEACSWVLVSLSFQIQNRLVLADRKMNDLLDAALKITAFLLLAFWIQSISDSSLASIRAGRFECCLIDSLSQSERSR